MENQVRSERVRLGMTQAELAERAGVTRQLVSAIEAGRHAPSVEAALRLASSLKISVEGLFGPSTLRDYVAVVPTSDSVSSAPVVISRVGDRQVYAPVRNLLTSSDAWAIVDGFVNDGEVQVLPDTDEAGFVIAGCDPLLGLSAALLARSRGPRVVAVHLSTENAIDALSRGVVHGVVVHGPASLCTPPLQVRRWRFASWRVGIASEPRRGITSVEQLAQRRTRTAQREDGAGTQRALERALERVGAERLPGPRVEGHVDAARHVAAGVAAGVTMEAAAAAFHLNFLPLETHQSELWIDTRYIDHRGAVALVDLLNDVALVRRASHLPGYDVAGMGTEVRAS